MGWLCDAPTLKNAGWTSIDAWQPEAFTFFNILTSALFCASTLLIVAVIFLLLRADERKSSRDAVFAGLCALLLANIHTYDILHIASAWGTYLVARSLAERRVDWSAWGRAAMAGAICSPAAAYQLYLFRTDPVFHARVGVMTLSPSFAAYVLGYGPTLLFAVLALALFLGCQGFRRIWRNESTFLMLSCWVIATFVLIYAPCSFQRKMIMGIHIPLCLLGGSATAYAGQACAIRLKRIPAFLVPLFVVALSVPVSLTNIANLIRDMNSQKLCRSFLTADDQRLFNWISRNTRPSDSLIGDPSLMLFVPAYCDRDVWCGHWGETPNFVEKAKACILLSEGKVLNSREFLAGTGAHFLVWPNVLGKTLPRDAAVLRAVYTNATYTIYEIK
ncbi:MAG: hypothetical protein P4L33_03215 [Capsulimonadaceae bacterium]|nr:hypothetical protein [Capsulimonadaceae bacterium]